MGNLILAMNLVGLAESSVNLDNIDHIRSQFNKAIEFSERFQKSSSKEQRIHTDLNWAYFKPVQFEKQHGTPKGQLKYIDMLISYREDKLKLASNEVENKSQLVSNLVYQGWLRSQIGNSGKAKASHQNAVLIAEELIKTFPSQKAYHSQLAIALNSLADIELYDGHIKETISLTQRALTNDPCEQCLGSIKSKLAHALLLDGQFKLAEKIYLEFKNMPREDAKKAGDLILLDIKKLKEAGLHHNEMGKIEALFKKS